MRTIKRHQKEFRFIEYPSLGGETVRWFLSYDSALIGSGVAPDSDTAYQRALNLAGEMQTQVMASRIDTGARQ